MNLIEQLGGYEEAKNLTMSQVGLKKHYDDLQQTLLQYRREHNIFEYGDDIVYKYEYNRNGLYVIHGKVFDGMVWIRNQRNQLICEKVEYLEHATPEEIQAGERL